MTDYDIPDVCKKCPNCKRYIEVSYFMPSWLPWKYECAVGKDVYACEKEREEYKHKVYVNGKDMKHYDVILVGAGLFNAVLCTRLIKQGKSVLVLEKRGHIGGNCYDAPDEYGVLVHKYGAHIFHTSNEDVWNFVNKYAKFNIYINSPIAKYNENEVYNLPFNLNTFCQIYRKAPNDAIKALKNDIEAHHVDNPKNLKEQAINMVGPVVFEKLVRGYTEKQWGRKCEELEPSIIKRLPLRMYADNNYFNDKYQGMPIGGYTQMISNMFAGADIELNVDYLNEKEKWNSLADAVYFSGCIDSYYGYELGHLSYRSLRFEEMQISSSDTQYTAVVNYTGSDVPYTRTIEHAYFYGNASNEYGKLTRTYEFPAEWKLGMEPYYPVNNDETALLLEKYKNLAFHGKENVYFVGRLGMFKYMDMDDTIEMALNYHRI